MKHSVMIIALGLCMVVSGCSKTPAPEAPIPVKAEVVKTTELTPKQEAQNLLALGDAKMRQGSDTWAFAYYKAANEHYPQKATQDKIKRIEDSWEPKDHYGPGSYHKSLIPDDLTEEEVKGHVMEILRGGYWFKCWVTPEEQAARMLMAGKMKSQMALEETRRKIQESDSASTVLLSKTEVKIAKRAYAKETVTRQYADGSSVTIEKEVGVENSVTLPRRKN